MCTAHMIHCLQTITLFSFPHSVASLSGVGEGQLALGLVATGALLASLAISLLWALAHAMVITAVGALTRASMQSAVCHSRFFRASVAG